MTALAAVLDRAAAFLRCLPEGTPEPDSVRAQSPGFIVAFDWYGHSGEFSLTLKQDGTLYFREARIVGILPHRPVMEEGQSAHFDGKTVPPAIADAIRKVTNG